MFIFLVWKIMLGAKYIWTAKMGQQTDDTVSEMVPYY